jgi:hypothetical protein
MVTINTLGAPLRRLGILALPARERYLPEWVERQDVPGSPPGRCVTLLLVPHLRGTIVSYCAAVRRETSTKER